MEKGGKRFQIQAYKKWLLQTASLQLNLKQMLNTNTFTFPSLKKIDLFGLNSCPLPVMKTSNPTNRYNTNLTEMKKEKQYYKPAATSTTSGISRYNNMCDEVMWFHQQNKYEAFLKMTLLFTITFGLCSLGLCELETFICISFIGFFHFGLKHGFFENRALRSWARASLLGSTFILAHQIFVTTLRVVSTQTAELLVSKYSTVIPALLTTALMVVYYNYSPLTVNAFEVCQRSLRESIINYLPNLIETIRKVYCIKYLLASTYLVIFLTLYAGLSLLRLDQFLANYGYMDLLNPYVFVAQGLTFLWMVIVCHGILQFVDELLLWHVAITGLYGKINQFTKIPIILELLKVVPSQQAQIQLDRQGLTRFFRVFSIAQSKLENNLNRTKLENIYTHSLAFLIKYLDRKNTLKNKIPVYSLPNSYSTEPRSYTTYESIFLEFSTLELGRCLEKMYSLSPLIEDLHIQKTNEKKLYQDLFYYVRMEIMQFHINSKILGCAKYLQIADFILEITLVNGMREQADITYKVAKLGQIASNIAGVFWLNNAIRERMESIQKKVNRILAKTAK